MDDRDRRILALLQQDASMPIAEIAKQVGLSSTPCWQRIRNLEAAGIIRSRVALLDEEKIGVGVTAFVSVRTGRHAADWLQQFTEAVRGIDEIVEVYRMSGETDYLLKIVVPSIAAYDAVYQRLIKKIDFADVTSGFALEQIKRTTALPLNYA